MARIVLFGPARDAAGRREDVIEADNLTEVLALAVARFGSTFESVLAVSQVWVNGDKADPHATLTAQDEVAVLPPVSGG